MTIGYNAQRCKAKFDVNARFFISVRTLNHNFTHWSQSCDVDQCLTTSAHLAFYCVADSADPDFFYYWSAWFTWVMILAWYNQNSRLIRKNHSPGYIVFSCFRIVGDSWSMFETKKFIQNRAALIHLKMDKQTHNTKHVALFWYLSGKPTFANPARGSSVESKCWEHIKSDLPDQACKRSQAHPFESMGSNVNSRILINCAKSWWSDLNLDAFKWLKRLY